MLIVGRAPPNVWLSFAVVMGLISGIVWLIYGPFYLFAFRRKLPEIRLHQGFIESQTGEDKRTVRLAECRWRVGPVKDMRLDGECVFLRRDNKELECGFTPAMRTKWEALLLLTGIPRFRGSFQERRPGAATSIQMSLGVAGIVIGRGLEAVLGLLPGIGNLCPSIAVTAGLLAAWVGYEYMSTDYIEATPRRNPVLAPSTFTVYASLGMGGWMLTPARNVATLLAFVCASVLIGALAHWDIRRRVLNAQAV
jgi:hypothetical protein